MQDTAHDQLRLGLNVRLRRHLMGLTQKQLAERMGCSFRKISMIERGKIDISVDTLFSLCRALEWNIPELLRGIE